MRFLAPVFPSSPHTRGETVSRRLLEVMLALHPRIHGGNPVRIRAPVFRAFHPRIHGGDANVPATQGFYQLSSPHTRGRRRHHPKPARCNPFIPAYTGDTSHGLVPQIHQAFHPRIRGADGNQDKPNGGGSLSSPHTRGRPTHITCGALEHPFIPAYAGETKVRTQKYYIPSFHPRIHGGDSVTVAVCMRSFLSSPHTRGRPGNLKSACWPGPFIPAYTGETRAHLPSER